MPYIFTRVRWSAFSGILGHRRDPLRWSAPMPHGSGGALYIDCGGWVEIAAVDCVGWAGCVEIADDLICPKSIGKGG